MNPVEVSRGASPVILGLPHTGTSVPDDIRARLNANGRLLADTDWHIHTLYDGLLTEETTVRASRNRGSCRWARRCSYSAVQTFTQRSYASRPVTGGVPSTVPSSVSSSWANFVDHHVSDPSRRATRRPTPCPRPAAPALAAWCASPSRSSGSSVTTPATGPGLGRRDVTVVGWTYDRRRASR